MEIKKKFTLEIVILETATEIAELLSESDPFELMSTADEMLQDGETTAVIVRTEDDAVECYGISYSVAGAMEIVTESESLSTV